MRYKQPRRKKLYPLPATRYPLPATRYPLPATRMKEDGLT
jgi:hypothetical protein